MTSISVSWPSCSAHARSSDDFRITDRDGTLLVRNAPSPGATSSLAIAEYVVERLGLGAGTG